VQVLGECAMVVAAQEITTDVVVEKDAKTVNVHMDQNIISIYISNSNKEINYIE